ncbi:MAG: C39 family peptidase, partial [Lachnospiraceae bacterium]|nr:C39 family peptidase [Lachnospiraceae bacterium]
YEEGYYEESYEENYEEAYEAEPETDSLPSPDPRYHWYMEHLPQFTLNSEKTMEIVPLTEVTSYRLAAVTMTDPDQLVKNRKKIRRQLASVLKERYDLKLDKEHPVHYIYADDVNYVVTFFGEDAYIYLMDVSRLGAPKLADADPDPVTKETLLEIARTNPEKSDVHFWNGISSSEQTLADPSTLPVSEDGAPAVPYYNQGLGFWYGTDGWICKDWPNQTFNINGHTMHEAGCGVFAAAMAISYLKQEIISPIEFKENGQYEGDGAYVTVGLESARMYNIKAVITSEWSEAWQALQEGHLVMENVGPGLFARYGHFILLTGILKDGSVVVNDPGNEYHTYWYDWTTFDSSVFEEAMHDDRTSFTIFG